MFSNEKSGTVYDVIIVGGGLSGAVFAFYSSYCGKNVLLLEKETSAGGCFHSMVEDDGFVLELGAHTMYNIYATIIDIIKKADIPVISHIKQPYKFWENGRLCSILKHLDVFGALRAVYKRNIPIKGATVKDYYSNVFGEKNYNNLIHPMTSAVVCQDSESFSADLILKRRPKDKKFPRKFTFEKGMASFVDTLLNRKGVKVELSAEVVNIEGSQVFLSDGRSFNGRDIALGVPANIAAKLLKSYDSELSGELEKIVVNKTKATGVIGDDVKADKFSYAVASAENACRSAVSADVIPHSGSKRGFTLHIKPDKTFDECKLDVANTFKIKKFDKVFNQEFNLPLLSVEHHERVATLDRLLKQHKNLFLLGNYFSGMSIEDCALRAKAEADRLLIEVKNHE